MQWTSGAEHSIDRFQRAVRRLRVEEKDDGHPNEIEASEEEVGSRLEVLEHDGVDEHCPSDTDGPAGNSKTVALCSHGGREDLGRDEECNCSPCGGVDQVEEEEQSDGCWRNLRSDRWVVAGTFVK